MIFPFFCVIKSAVEKSTSSFVLISKDSYILSFLLEPFLMDCFSERTLRIGSLSSVFNFRLGKHPIWCFNYWCVANKFGYWIKNQSWWVFVFLSIVNKIIILKKKKLDFNINMNIFYFTVTLSIFIYGLLFETIFLKVYGGILGIYFMGTLFMSNSKLYTMRRKLMIPCWKGCFLWINFFDFFLKW